MKTSVTIALTACCLLIAPNPGMTQKLDDFENGINKTSTSKSNKRAANHRRHEGHATDVFGEIIADVFEIVLTGGGAMSLAKVSSDPYLCEEAGISPREFGDRQTPFARADFTYQFLDSDLDAFDYRAEVGYGPIGLHLNTTHYREENPRDRLDLIRAFALYRMTLWDQMEIDMGYGTLWIDGNKKDARSTFTMPIMIYPDDKLAIEFRPSWASNVSDYDLGILISGKYSSFKAGYRWVRSPGESLDGPYVGMAMHF